MNRNCNIIFRNCYQYSWYNKVKGRCFLNGNKRLLQDFRSDRDK
nr:MAG TPA: hypothetical protein [Caudoviricetes sp.]